MALPPNVSQIGGDKRGRDDEVGYVGAAKRQKVALEEDSLYSDNGIDSDSDGEDDTYSTPQTPRTPASPRPRYPSDEKRHKCYYEGCEKAFKRPARLEEHIRSHTNERPFVCTFAPCEKTFLRKSHLKHHIQSAHTSILAFGCTWKDCKKRFSTSTRLKRHIQSHEGLERFRCTSFPPCNETFRKKGTLQKHVDLVHLDRKPFPCTHVDEETGQQCPLGYATAAKLKSHEQKAHQGQRYSCTICSPIDVTTNDVEPVNFSTLAELQIHVQEAHPTQCEHCGMRFSRTHSLQVHVDSVHSGIPVEMRKNVVCPYEGCSKTYTKQANLNTHVRSVHEKSKPFICGSTDLSQTKDLQDWDAANACEQTFAHKRSLEDHVRKVHIGGHGPRKPPKSRKKHISTLTKLTGEGYAQESGRRIACIEPTCEYRFMRECDLVAHAQSKHGMDEQEIAEALIEREASTGGKFWLGGLDDDEFLPGHGYGPIAPVRNGGHAQTVDFNGNFDHLSLQERSPGDVFGFIAGGGLLDQHHESMVIDPVLANNVMEGS